jgi:hypothetical protein
MDNSAKLSAPTSAHALYEILRSVKYSDVPTVARAWVKVLDAEWGTPRFAERHGEVSRLLNETFTQIKSLAPEQVRERQRSFASWCWKALTMPDSSWEDTHPLSLTSEEHLNYLANTGDIIASQLGETALAPGYTDLTDLRAQCEEWVSVLSGQTEIVGEPLRRQLLGQMHHLLWLIDEAGTFGVSRVVEHGDQVTGTLVRAAYTQPSKIRVRSEFRKRTARLTVALGLVAGALTGVGASVEAATQDLLAIEQLAHTAMPAGPSETRPPTDCGPAGAAHQAR